MIKLHERKEELILMQASTVKHAVDWSSDRSSSSDKLQTAPQWLSWENPPAKSIKSLVANSKRLFLPLLDENCTSCNLEWCRGNSIKVFFTFNSKAFWGWTERSCLSVCTLLSWLIRKNKLKLSFWTRGFLLILYVLLTTASLVCYSPKRLPDISCSPQHHFPKVPTQ